MVKISAIIKDLKVISITTPFNLPIWLVQKTGGSWRMSVDYYKLNQLVTPIEAAVQEVVSLLDQTNTSSHMQLLIRKMSFFSIPISKYHQKLLDFSWRGQQHTFTILPQGISILQSYVII